MFACRRLPTCVPAVQRTQHTKPIAAARGDINKTVMRPFAKSTLDSLVYTARPILLLDVMHVHLSLIHI